MEDVRAQKARRSAMEVWSFMYSKTIQLLSTEYWLLRSLYLPTKTLLNRPAEWHSQLLWYDLLWRRHRGNMLRLWWRRKIKSILRSGTFQLPHNNTYFANNMTIWLKMFGIDPQYTDGGCPCPQGQEKCAAGEWDVQHKPKLYGPNTDSCAHTLSDPLNGIASYCAIVCCDSIKEQICIDYDEDGYVNQYCAAVSVWSHLHLCCTWFDLFPHS